MGRTRKKQRDAGVSRETPETLNERKMSLRRYSKLSTPKDPEKQADVSLSLKVATVSMKASTRKRSSKGTDKKHKDAKGPQRKGEAETSKPVLKDSKTKTPPSARKHGVKDEPPKDQAAPPLLNERKMSLRRYAKLMPITGMDSLKQQINRPDKLRSVDLGENGGEPLSCDEVARDSRETNQAAAAFLVTLNERNEEARRISEEKHRERVEGLRRIAGMKSKIGVNPLSQFPKEIWTQIMKDLSPQDLYNMCQLHDVFGDLMERTEIQDILLPLVMDYGIPFLSRLVPPQSWTYAPKLKKIASLRRVSKSVRNGVDNWIENRILDLMQNLKPGLSVNHPDIEMTDNMNALKKIKMFSRGPIMLRPKRFFLRSLAIMFTDAGDASSDIFSKFTDAITELMEAVGEQILHFRLSSFVRQGVSAEQMYTTLREWLMLMPNLAWLELGMLDATVTNQTPNVFNGSIPMLPKLERVDVLKYADSFSYAVSDAVFASNPHVKYHTAHSLSACHESRFTQPCVLSLSLETVPAVFYEQLRPSPMSPLSFCLLQTVSSRDLNWNLKQLYLKDSRQNIQDINRAFQCLQKFQTLEELSLSLNCLILGNNETGYLRLPNLKKFNLEFGPSVTMTTSSNEPHSFFALHFLLHCSKLESLTWNNRILDSQPIRRDIELQSTCGQFYGMVDFKGGFGDLTASNVWQVFPRLRSMTVKYLEGENIDERKIYERKYQKGRLVWEKVDPYCIELE